MPSDIFNVILKTPFIGLKTILSNVLPVPSIKLSIPKEFVSNSGIYLISRNNIPNP